MIIQRTDEWINNYEEDYFDRQFNNPYQSTIAIANWIQEKMILNFNSEQKVLDIATGKGANLSYFSKIFPKCSFLGLDLNKYFVDEGNSYFTSKKLDNCKLEEGDLYNLDVKLNNKFDGITCLQTLSWLPEYQVPLKKFMDLNPKWILLSSLFFDGLVNCKIEIDQYDSSQFTNPRKTFYNIYSIPLLENFCINNGFSKVQYIPFNIEIDLPQMNPKIMGTYTKKLENGNRIQVSGPLLMNWHFILIQK